MAGRKKGLILTDVEILPGTVFSAVQKKYSLSADDIDVVTNSCTILYGKMPAATASADVVVSLAGTPGRHTAQFLVELARILRHGGSLLVQEPISRRDITPQELQKVGTSLGASIQTQAVLERSLMVAGFTSSSATSEIAEGLLAQQWMGITPASVGALQGGLLQPFAVTAQKPDWVGSSFTLKGKTKTPAPAAAASQPAVQSTNGTLKIAMDDGPSPMEDDELIDEDSLLTEEDLARPPLPTSAPDDCDVGKSGRKACKNCTCGRAELEAKQAPLTIDMLENPESACGSCGLGDAFRCAGCPYRGLPPFKLGEKVTLSTSLLAADA
eukprot:TRINITY_DN5675_c0_g1_i1.p1 TRINITY_DN5675_c0_g1~~TRINITY_DN5675_c0_g1_i1.p1  ORF type:complete len:327 (-),score=61.58 TRINITY_DN5675_c0_g1_i1:26-1006(-)